MFDKQWVCKEACRNGSSKQALSYPPFLVTLLQSRGLTSQEEMDAFLHPSLDQLSDPFLMCDMESAVDRILQAAETGEPVVVFGDYDADGITATSILYHFFRSVMELNVSFYLPDRFREGYGMSETAIRRIAAEGVSLVVTVDNGVRCQQEIELAGQLGMDVIVTDHHLCGETIPVCCAVVDPKRPDDPTHANLAGVGVAYRVIQALALSLGLEEEPLCYLPLVALGTIGDAMPMTGENRILVKYGLERLQDCPWLGLSKLLDQCGARQPVSALSLSFSVVPKLNAAGRMGDAARAVQLLLAEDPEEAEMLAEELYQENSKRQALEAQIVTEALQPEHLCTAPEDAIVISIGDGWHPGVIGIVASRLVDKFHKPAIVLSLEPETEEACRIARGSARSVEEFPLFEALSSCGDLLLKFGGHDRAAGLSLDVSVLPVLIQRLNAFSSARRIPSASLSRLEIDCMLRPEDLTLENVKWLSQLEPFGEGNSQPLFCTSGLQLLKCTPVGEKGKHLKLQFLGNNGVNYDGIAFQQGSYAALVGKVDLCSCVYRLERNEWANRERVSLVVTDLLEDEYLVDNQGIPVYNKKYTTCRAFLLGREELVWLYKICRTFGEGFAFGDLEQIKALMKQKGYGCSWYQLRSALAVFEDLQLVRREKKGRYTVVSVREKVDLEQSGTYRELKMAL